MTKRNPKEPYAIKVYFTPRIRCDGELTRIRLVQDDQTIELTRDQAQSLAHQIGIRMIQEANLKEQA